MDSEKIQQVTVQEESYWRRLCGLFAQLMECCSNKFTTDATQCETDSRRFSPQHSRSRRQKWRNFFSFIARLFTRKRKHHINLEVPTRIPRLPSYTELESPTYDLQIAYSMRNQVRGIALIFNHEYFAMPEKMRRFGTDKDRDRMEKNLQRLKFDVRVYNDCFLDDIDRELLAVSRSDHSAYDCLLVVVLTHGDEKTIACYNADYRIDRLIRPFTDRNCPSLRDKPRLFLIQACRGDELDRGFTLRQNGAVRNENTHIVRRVCDAIDNAVNGFWGPRHVPGEQVALPAIEKDFLLVRSTMHGYASFRNPDTGSWFIQELCKELELNGKHEDMLTLLTHVNYAVAQRESNPHKFKQVLCISSMLTRRLYLR